MLDTRKLLLSVGIGAIATAMSVAVTLAQQTIAPASATPTPGPMPEVLQKYTPVTAERLRKPEDGNWLLFRRTYDGWGYSPLAQITPANVGRLELVWSVATGQIEGHQAPPIVNNGVMFVATPGNQLIALEAKTGNVLWRYKRPLPEDFQSLHPTNRGVGLLGDKVYFRICRREARCSRRQNGQGGVDGQSRRLQERLLHVSDAARCRRQGDARHVRWRTRRTRLRRRV